MKKRLNIFTLGFLIFLSNGLSALEINVVDQAGNPISQAVVSLKGDQVSASDVAKTAVMDQVNRAYVPYVLPVYEGTLVSFPNSDNIRHHVYSFSPAKKFQIKLYSGEPTDPIKFDKLGIVALGCNIHDSMNGYIYVLDTPVFTKTNIEGNAQLDVTKVSNGELAVWHPDLVKIDTSYSIKIAEINEVNSPHVVTLQIKDKHQYKAPKSKLEEKFEKLRKGSNG